MAKVKCTMDQFIEGLKACGLLVKIKEQPTLWEPMFVHSNASTCRKLIVREYMEINENTCRPKIRSAIVSGRGFLLICSRVCCVLDL